MLGLPPELRIAGKQQIVCPPARGEFFGFLSVRPHLDRFLTITGQNRTDTVGQERTFEWHLWPIDGMEWRREGCGLATGIAEPMQLRFLFLEP